MGTDWSSIGRNDHCCLLMFVFQLTVIHPDLSKSTEDPMLSERMAEERSLLDNSVAHALVEEHHADFKTPNMINDVYMGPNTLDSSQQVLW